MRIHIYLNNQLKEALETICEAKYITASEYIRGLIIKDIGLGEKIIDPLNRKKTVHKPGDLVTKKFEGGLKIDGIIQPDGLWKSLDIIKSDKEFEEKKQREYVHRCNQGVWEWIYKDKITGEWVVDPFY